MLGRPRACMCRALSGWEAETCFLELSAGATGALCRCVLHAQLAPAASWLLTLGCFCVPTLWVHKLLPFFRSPGSKALGLW